MEANSLGYFISIYGKFAKAENKSHRYIEAITGATKKFDIFLGGSTNPQDITADDLRRYILHLQERYRWSGHPTIKSNHDSLSSNTIAHHIRHIKSFWAWMYGEGFLEQNSLAQVKTPQETLRVVTPLTSGDVTQLIKVIPRDNHKGYRDACVIISLYGTLLRITELLDLTLPNVNLTSGQITVLGKGDREIERYPVIYGAILKVKDRQKIKPNQVIVEWDPFTIPILTEVPGKVKFGDIMDGVTMQERRDKVTGMISRVIVESRDMDARPRISIKDKESKTASTPGPGKGKNSSFPQS